MEDRYQEKVARVMRRWHAKIQFSAGFTLDHLVCTLNTRFRRDQKDSDVAVTVIRKRRPD